MNNFLSWGSTGAPNEAIPLQRLRHSKASVISNGSCRIRYIRLRDSNICTDIETGSPCEGDEGAPLTVVEFDDVSTQVGIFSYVSETRFRGCERGFPRENCFVDFRYNFWLIVNFLQPSTHVRRTTWNGSKTTLTSSFAKGSIELISQILIFLSTHVWNFLSINEWSACGAWLIYLLPLIEPLKKPSCYDFYLFEFLTLRN